MYINMINKSYVVGIGIRYCLDGLGIESHWARDFPQPPKPALSSTQPTKQWVPRLFPGGKATGAWPCLPTPIQ
jgi:hypothetical protein